MTSKKSLKLFKKAAVEVPAYGKFLQKEGFDLTQVKKTVDFSRVPIMSKKTYLQKFEHRDLMWVKDLHSPLSICATSGSTGEPYYFPRNDTLAWQASFMAETFLLNSSHGTKGRTLVLMGFGMGVWIGGLITLRAFEIAAKRLNLPVSFLPTGYNKTEIFKALKKLAPEFDQTIIGGYPPFIKELIDEAETEGVNLKKLNIRLLFAAEAFTETFRNYVCEKAGIKNPLLDTLNIYGTADMGAMAHETPLSILVRQLTLRDPAIYQEFFGQIEKTPTLAQYNPEFIEFESLGHELLITGDAAMPFIRYAVGDNGGIKTYNAVSSLLGRYGINLKDEINKAGIKHTVSKKPFVYVYERTDLSVTLHGIIIYPEFIKEGLLSKEMLPFFTERFSMATKHDIKHNQFIKINLELRSGVKPTAQLEKDALKAIRASLLEKSSEFSEVSKNKMSKDLIKIVLWEKGHPLYFSPGTKQNWVEKNNN